MPPWKAPSVTETQVSGAAVVELDTYWLPPGERQAAVVDFVNREVIRNRVLHPEPIASRWSAASLGPVRVIRVSTAVPDGCRPAISARAARHVRADDPGSLILKVQLSGRSVAVHGGRRDVIEGGQLAVHDGTRPYAWVYPGVGEQVAFRVPRALLGVSAADLAQISFHPIGRDNPVAAHAGRQLVDMASDPRLATDPYADVAVAAGLGLVRAAILSELSRRDQDRVPADDGLPDRIVAYVHDHLREPELSPQHLADAHFMSVRQLYAVLGRVGATPGDLIRRLRLEQARVELSRRDPGERRPIAAIARRWGFSDPTHFARAFRRQYGASPQQWRLTQAGVSDSRTS
jgi:AraC-like DNA-binding protein